MAKSRHTQPPLVIPAPSARLRWCRQSTGVGASCPATNKNRSPFKVILPIQSCNLKGQVTSSEMIEVRDGNTCFKCSPPIRDAANKENLWEALLVMQSPIHPNSNLLPLINYLHVIEK
ncbi:hypothetical protein VPH35_128407 [Triticum aestivum]